MLDLLKDCCNYFLLSSGKKHLNEHIIYCIYNLIISYWKKVYETFQVYYTILFIAFEFMFILKQIFCLPKKPQ